jgi:predicted metal-dependent hydrolase
MRELKATRKTRPARRELLKIEGRAVEVNVRLNPRARRLIVKVHPSTGEITVVSPSQRALDRAMEFARGQTAWIARQLAHVPAPVALVPGAHVPFQGLDHTIRPSEGGRAGRGAVWIDDDGHARVIRVAGRPEHTPRRTLDFLKREARRLLEERTGEFAAAIGARHKAITVRDTASRWGSCTSGRTLSFSWRLVMAPPFVLDYVVAHEVAHMREMNHGPVFWRIVETLVGDVRRPQKWLRDNGVKLHRYAPRG